MELLDWRSRQACAHRGAAPATRMHQRPPLCHTTKPAPPSPSSLVPSGRQEVVRGAAAQRQVETQQLQQLGRHHAQQVGTCAQRRGGRGDTRIGWQPGLASCRSRCMGAAAGCTRQQAGGQAPTCALRQAWRLGKWVLSPAGPANNILLFKHLHFQALLGQERGCHLRTAEAGITIARPGRQGMTRRAYGGPAAPMVAPPVRTRPLWPAPTTTTSAGPCSKWAVQQRAAWACATSSSGLLQGRSAAALACPVTAAAAALLCRALPSRPPLVSRRMAAIRTARLGEGLSPPFSVPLRALAAVSAACRPGAQRPGSVRTISS